MWYGSYDHAIRRETTAIGFAASVDGVNWHKHPRNPVLRPDPRREWESNYVGSGSVVRLADGSFRYYYASRKQPPFENLYFAINTARWKGPVGTGGEIPASQPASARPGGDGNLAMPPRVGDAGIVAGGPAGAWIDVLETIDEDDLIVRVWYVPAAAGRPGNSRRRSHLPRHVDAWAFRGRTCSGRVAHEALPGDGHEELRDDLWRSPDAGAGASRWNAAPVMPGAPYCGFTWVRGFGLSTSPGGRCSVPSTAPWPISRRARSMRGRSLAMTSGWAAAMSLVSPGSASRS